VHKSKVIKVTQSPNLACGHEVWVTVFRRPKRLRERCVTCRPMGGSE